MKYFSINDDFSHLPGGRKRDQSKNSGEELRDDHLAPLVKEAIKNGEKVKVDLAGTEGLPASFLDETFGGLLTVHGIDYNELKDHLIVHSDEEQMVVDEVWDFIHEKVEK